MIKGINRQIIELETTSSTYYEKAWLVIKPEYANMQQQLLEKEAKKIANVKEHKPTAYKWTTRERKKNPTKSAIIKEIAEFLKENSANACENVEITNAERQIAFTIGENNYEFTLVQKRKPKN